MPMVLVVVLGSCGKFFGRSVAERGMGPAKVVLEPPSLDDPPGIVGVVEPVRPYLC